MRIPLSEPERPQDLLNYQRCDLCNYNICTQNRPLRNSGYDTKKRGLDKCEHYSCRVQLARLIQFHAHWTLDNFKMQVLAR